MTDTQTPDSLRPGDVVGPWRVEGYAGRGSYGVVYRARRAGHPSAVPVALKIAVFPSDPRFDREVALLSRNRHPGMPQLLDRGWWQASDEVAHPYFAMEWIRGRPLYEWARLHNPTCREVLLVLAQVAWTLEVLVPPNTREYRSPESLRFEWGNWSRNGAHYESCPADDLYALGVAAYRLVTGVYPPPGTDPEALKAQSQVPLPQRRPAHEFNRRVVPELSALIERMLANVPEARGTAREIAEAAESAAERAKPEANVPFLDLEWPQDKARAEPVRALPVSDAALPVVEAAASAPIRVRREHLVRSWVWRPGVVAAASLLMAVVGTCWLNSGLQGDPPEGGRTEAQVLGTAPKAGTRGLGDSAPTARLAARESPVAPKTGAIVQFPDKPLPGQMRSPCRVQGQVEINGGCWQRFADVRPPCVGGTHEWKGECYWPVPERPRVQPRTAKPPR